MYIPRNPRVKIDDPHMDFTALMTIPAIMERI